MRQPRVPEDFLGGYERMLTDVAETGRLLLRPELDELRDLGERAAEAGYGLGPLIGLYLGETRRLWGSLPGAVRASGASASARTVDALLGAVDTAVGALGEGHERAQRLAVRQEEAARREFVDDLLYGRSDLGRLAERAERFGLRLARSHAVAVAEGEERYDDVHPVVRRVERELIARFGEHDVLLTTKDGRLVCVAASGERERAILDAFVSRVHDPGSGYVGEGRVAVGREHPGAGGVVSSYEEALSALELADRLELPGPVLRAAELLVFPVLLRDRAAMADLVRTVLGPLTRARGGAGPLLETLTTCAAAGYVNAEAARRLNVGVRTLSYRLERIRALTGYDPGDALQRFTLETAAMGARLLGWPGSPL
ncbi:MULTISPECIES: PucR family transcriptional regulator [Streptomyces]|uniref:Helix-turn-helix domain-containing protein n=2 Tax=Streptomyces violaceusniger group TaxID=2839105 RepID=A0ABD5J7D5_9ACTN|nr:MULTISPECIES: helix-turn-helix domain-containing protein [Streptomyces]MEE4583184.1 helix-turn-helix domain-containing protein [Streptomyces sp. DSM 41602]KUL56074.1 regulator [Streptomyces violaceusniger]RSS47972.1 PucR family transcriptional regulator [Streptomyces sp. WAC05858]WTA80202.1 helix-turn-helix domain-containing protein [Streptomyces antimycoticus]WTB09605.1 helix-turn-helix domain-containing protein [Streptomyces antimycoticus]